MWSKEELIWIFLLLLDPSPKSDILAFHQLWLFSRPGKDILWTELTNREPNFNRDWRRAEEENLIGFYIYFWNITCKNENWFGCRVGRVSKSYELDINMSCARLYFVLCSNATKSRNSRKSNQCCVLNCFLIFSGCLTNILFFLENHSCEWQNGSTIVRTVEVSSCQMKQANIWLSLLTWLWLLFKCQSYVMRRWIYAQVNAVVLSSSLSFYAEEFSSIFYIRTYLRLELFTSSERKIFSSTDTPKIYPFKEQRQWNNGMVKQN